MTSVRYDQHFLTDEKILEKIARIIAGCENEVIEVGVGSGNLTRELLNHKLQVFGVEIDKNLEPIILQIKNQYPNFDYIIQNGVNWIDEQKKADPSVIKAIVSNLPYSISETLLHRVCSRTLKQNLYLLVPTDFVHNVIQNSFVLGFYKVTLQFEIDRTAFEPAPDTDSIFVQLEPLSQDITRLSINQFLIRWIYQREHTILKNALFKGLDYWFRQNNKKVTKNEVKSVIANLFPQDLLVQKPSEIIGIYDKLNKINWLEIVEKI